MPLKYAGAAFESINAHHVHVHVDSTRSPIVCVVSTEPARHVCWISRAPLYLDIVFNTPCTRYIRVLIVVSSVALSTLRRMSYIVRTYTND